jgi:glyoxylase I family protein
LTNGSSDYALGHLAISVTDIDRSIRFYAELFGLKCLRRYYNPRLEAEVCFLGGANFVLEVFTFSKQAPLPDYRKELMSDLRTVGVKHFALKVTDIETAFKKIISLGITQATQLTMGGSGFRYFYIKDPDGILVEIMENIHVI